MQLKRRDVSRNSQPCRSNAAEKNGKRTAPPLAWPPWPVESGSGPSEALTPYEHIGKVLDDAAKSVQAKGEHLVYCILLTAVRKNNDPCADEACTPTKDPVELDIFDNGREGKSIIQSLGDPLMSLGDEAEANGAMVICNGVIVAGIKGFANELECFARSKVSIRIVMTISASARFAAEFCNPARV